MKSLNDLHLENNAWMGIYNNHTVPVAYHDLAIEYKAVRENALLVDYSHMSIVSVMGDDAWAVVNHMASADISIIRDEQGIYSLVLNEDGTIRGDMYVLCTSDGYYLLSENIPASEIIERLTSILESSEELDIVELPEINSMADSGWGAIMLEGPYSWEVMSEIYGYDIIGLPYFEYINEADELVIFRCGKHGEFAYMAIGQEPALVKLWENILSIGDKYELKTGGIQYQDIVRLENTGWDESIFSGYSKNPIELQMQWAIQYDKENFIGKSVIEPQSHNQGERKLVGMLPTAECSGIKSDDKVLVEGKEVGIIVKSGFSPALQSFISLALIDNDYALADIPGFEILTAEENIPARTQSVPFLYNLSMLVNPAEHSYIDSSKSKRIM
ncbi:aminomethyltransferase family protein [Kosakonia sacchari]|uniref:Glycine cleavage system T protein (Aminomethyltransferase) n=1 Tax=Kosakonia sacchari TaxID=1158459 RepID=A0A1G4XEN0_9ENTR|nr:aminomethyltransferase family protein [Kosakonia sacchari]AHJ74437.1 aminomethyltransferase [Kosakonia sacchari SP1]SCX39575.1 Glycine cleavage system T protein (aminomethyltransferase) [Kosakonia sacchari]